MKKAISILLVITILLNVFGFGLMNFKASAEVVTAASILLGITVGAIITAIVEIAREDIRVSTDPMLQLQHQQLMDSLTNALANGNGELLVINGDRLYPAPGLSGDALELAEFLADYLNDRGGAELFNNTYSHNGAIPSLTANQYKDLKNAAMDAFKAYLMFKGGDELSNTEGFNTIPFDFVGPLPGFVIPSSTGYVSYNSQDYIIDTPYRLPIDYWHSKEEVPAIFERNPTNSYGDHWIVNKILSGYGCGIYVLYNNDIYFYSIYNVSSVYNNSMAVRNPFTEYYVPAHFMNADGILLSDDGCTSIGGLMGGWFTVLSPSAPNIPTNIKPEDLTTSSGGGSVTLSRSHAEDVIGQLMQTGIITSNSTLTLDENGDITAVDGIDLSKLEALLNNISNSQIKFSDIQGYLQAIQAACQGTDLDMDAILSILSAIQQNVVTAQDLQNAIAGIKDYSGSLGDIKSELETQTGTLTGIQEGIQSIADELTKTGELDIDKEDFELNTVIGEHIGLNEAEGFVSRWTLVNQCKGLLYNVLNADRFNNSAPNFKFYYDSNKDGTKEVYTALDLSFLDNTLTNDNLVDKSRFQNPMTVRQFIQFLMIFICYFAFVIKLLRKLPGLVSGGESAESVGLDYQKIQRDQIS